MKKFAVLLAVAFMAASANAQTVQESKASDNIYVGVNGGMAVKTTGNRWLHNLNPNLGVRIGRWFTPVFGLAVDGTAYFSNKPYISTGTVVRATNVSLLGTVNFTNLFGGYPGQPRFFEGFCEGAIARQKAGCGGFGYDPVFLADAYPGRTLAEVSEEEKNAVSHRGNAVRKMAAWLKANCLQ